MPEALVLTVLKRVYYCEHCKRHRLTASAIARHEPRCIYNPQRSECGWHPGGPQSPADLAAAFATDPDLDALRNKLNGCPACMLAVVVQARKHGLDDEDARGFHYLTEVDAYRKAERMADVW